MKASTAFSLAIGVLNDLHRHEKSYQAQAGFNVETTQYSEAAKVLQEVLDNVPKVALSLKASEEEHRLKLEALEREVERARKLKPL